MYIFFRKPQREQLTSMLRFASASEPQAACVRNIEKVALFTMITT